MIEPEWLPESDFKSDMPVWTRALVGEMLPEVVSPLGWSMVWESCAALGWRDAMVRRMGFDEDEFNRTMPETIGLIGGYGYLNASHLRIWADRSPDLTVDHIDRILVNNGSPLPGHSRMSWHNPDAVATGMLTQWYRWVMESRNQTELDAGHEDSVACRRARPDFTELTDLQLVRRATRKPDTGLDHRALGRYRDLRRDWPASPRSSVAERAWHDRLGLANPRAVGFVPTGAGLTGARAVL